MGLKILDIILTIVHLAIIGFNLFGWIWPQTRRAHLFVVIVTAFCWLVLGIWYGFGYCPVTDWQWHVKARLGEHDLPGSFIEYYADKISGQHINSMLIDYATGICFAVTAMLSVYVNFFLRKKRAIKQ